MSTAREQTIEAVFAACQPYSDEEDEFYLAANTASDVWEPLLRETKALLDAIPTWRITEHRGGNYGGEWCPECNRYSNEYEGGKGHADDCIVARIEKLRARLKEALGPID